MLSIPQRIARKRSLSQPRYFFCFSFRPLSSFSLLFAFLNLHLIHTFLLKGRRGWREFSSSDSRGIFWYLLEPLPWPTVRIQRSFSFFSSLYTAPFLIMVLRVHTHENWFHENWLFAHYEIYHLDDFQLLSNDCQRLISQSEIKCCSLCVTISNPSPLFLFVFFPPPIMNGNCFYR